MTTNPNPTMANIAPNAASTESATVPTDMTALITRALEEDVGSGDCNKVVVDADQRAHAVVTARESAVLAGCPWFEAVFQQLSADDVRIDWHLDDGDALKPEQTVCELTGPARTLLTGERTALNFLQTLSASATVTRHFVDRVKGTNAAILDTRKTLPGLRSAQKYAVVCGGGVNHRFGLFDGVLIKENHISVAGSITTAVERVRAADAQQWVQVEVEDLHELDEALAADVDSVLLDNFPDHVLTRAVNMCRGHLLPNRRSVVTEASGDINLSNVRAVADTGVDRISIGGLTKHITAVDLSMRLAEPGG